MSEIHPAPREFAEWACATRPDWDRSELDGALLAIGAARPPDREIPDHWRRTVNSVLPLLWDGQATVRQVRDLAGRPGGHAGSQLAGPGGLPDLDAVRQVLAQASAATAGREAAGDDRG